MNLLDYSKPETIEEALSFLEKYGKRAKIIAGGTDVMPLMKKKVLTPDFLVSLRNVPGLNRIAGNGTLSIGAATTHRAIEKSPLIRNEFSALADAVDVLGSVQIRNVATIGGNICTAAPSADTAPPLLAAGALVEIVNGEGERTTPLEDFFKGPGKTVLGEGDIVTGFTIPQCPLHTASAYWKHKRRLALDIPILGVAVQLSLDGDVPSGRDFSDRAGSIASIFQSLEEDNIVCRDVRIALGVAAPQPMRACRAEALLRGRPIGGRTVAEAARTASEEASPRDSFRGEAWYRREMIRVFVQRMILKCLERIADKDGSRSGAGSA